MPVCTVDGESLGKVTIHNFAKRQKIIISVLPYGRKNGSNLDRHKQSQ